MPNKIASKENTLEIVRIVAVYRDRGQRVPSSTTTVLCGLDDAGNVVDGQWMGFSMDEGTRYPFIWETFKGVFDYGWGPEENERNPTTLGRVAIREGLIFSTMNDPTFPDKWEYTWQVETIHSLSAV